MSDPIVIPPAKPSQPSRLPSYIGILIIIMSVVLFAAILFIPKPTSTTDAEIQQVLTIMAALLGVFGGWQYGSSVSSQTHKDDPTPPKGT